MSGPDKRGSTCIYFVIFVDLYSYYCITLVNNSLLQIGFTEGDGLEFLNQSAASSQPSRFENAGQLALSASMFSNINTTGKWLYDISSCATQINNGNSKCEKTVTLVLNSGQSEPVVTTVGVTGQCQICKNAGICKDSSDDDGK